MAARPDAARRSSLPITTPRRPGLTTYDAKDPDTAYPPIEETLPPEGAPNVLVVLLDDVGFGASSAFGGPCAMPTAERLAGDGLKFNRFHTTALCSPTRAALLSGRNHHTVGMGGITEIATSAPGYNSLRPHRVRAAGRDAEAQRLQHRAAGQVPRGAGLADQPDGPVRQLARRGRRLRVLLRLHRRRDQPVLPRPVRRHDPGGAGQDPGGGLPPDRGPDRQGHRVGAPAEGADGRQAVLHVLRARRDARPPPGAGGVVGQVQGRVRRRAGTRCASRRSRARRSWA